VVRTDLHRLQPLCEVVQWLTGMDLLWTLFSHWVQPIHHREMTMWMYAGTGCPDRPFSKELGDTKINTQICGVLTLGADLDLSSSLIPIREGVDSPWVSPLGPTFGYLRQF
jgi:hypothetical protein